MTRVLGYVRVSLEKQAEQGNSLEVQRHRLTAYANLYDLEIEGIIEDVGFSGKSLSRPGLESVLNRLARREVDAVLVAKLDRLTRSVRDLDFLLRTHFREENRAALLSVAEQIDTRSASGRLVLNVLASVSQWERETIGERTAAAMQHKRSRGEYTGGRLPYGYRLAADGVHLLPEEREQEIILEIQKRRIRGWSLKKIARSLVADSFFPRRGGAWHPKQISRILKETERPARRLKTGAIPTEGNTVGADQPRGNRVQIRSAIPTGLALSPP